MTVQISFSYIWTKSDYSNRKPSKTSGLVWSDQLGLTAVLAVSYIRSDKKLGLIQTIWCMAARQLAYAHRM